MKFNLNNALEGLSSIKSWQLPAIRGGNQASATGTGPGETPPELPPPPPPNASSTI